MSLIEWVFVISCLIIIGFVFIIYLQCQYELYKRSQYKKENGYKLNPDINKFDKIL